MKMNHGYTTREEWKAAYSRYYGLIREINEHSHSLLNVNRTFDEWFEDYKKQSMEMQRLYHENDEFIEKDILYFVDHPEHWQPEIAESLLSYLFRHCMQMEDTVTVYMTTQSLQKYYEEREDEISIMKCYYVLSVCLHFLDMYHFAQDILDYCTKGKEIYEHHYDELNQEEKSLGLSLYDITNVVRFGILEVDENFANYYTETLFSEVKHGIAMVDQFMLEADMSLKVNKVLPFLRDSMIEGFISTILLINKEQVSEDVAIVLYDWAKSYLQRHEEDPASVNYVKYNIIFMMSQRIQEKANDDEILSEMQKELEKLPIGRVEKKENFDTELLDTLLCGITAIRTITEHKPEKQFILKGLLQKLIEYISYLPFGKFLDHVADNIIFQHVCPLLQYIDDEEALLKAVLHLTVFRQIQTGIHSLMVGKAASCITYHMIQERPELLIGQLDCHSVEEVKAKEKEFLKYIYLASLVHDVGKVCCTNVINMQYRRLSNIEFKTIQFHPVSSGQILKQIPQLSCFHDIAVGHHKSYDGTYGYPKEFDNCASSQRVFIDLMSICDSLDAATDTYGRNYAKPKSFETVFEEFQRDKGTRYSDAIIDMIAENKIIQQELKELMETGREEVYRETFNLLRTEYENTKEN